MKIAVAGVLALALMPSGASAQTLPGVQRGLTLARTHCARCHSIDKASTSPHTIAPPFRDLHKRYKVEYLAEALGEGLVTGHPSMPEFRFAPDQINDFIAFLNSLK
jgi:mono/diheme cytochrome c family protein